MVPEGFNRALDDLAHHRAVAVGLLQLRRGDPDGGFGGQRLASLVQNLSGLFVGFEPGEREPEVDVLRAALHRSRQQHARVVLPRQVHHRLPQLDAVGNVLQRAPEHASLAVVLRLELSGLHPDLHRVGKRYHAARENRLGVLRRVESRSLDPHVLGLWTRVAPFLDEAPRRLELSREFLQPRGGDPPGRVLRVGRDDRLQEQPSFLDVGDLRLGRDLDGL